MASSNLFKQLYSRNNSPQPSGFVCSNAVNIDDTSFDISGDKAVITDSNGEELASIPLNLIHAAGITQYNIETRILQPYSCYVLQGQEYGLALTTYYFHLPDELASVQDFEMYVNLEFDMVYNQFDHKHIHVNCPATESVDFIQSINECFEQNDINVSVSIQEVKDDKDHKTYGYLVFQGGQEGYFFYVKNLMMRAAVQSDEFPDSPFSTSPDSMKLVTFNLIKEYHPVIPGQEYDENTYSVDCDLYNWMLQHNDDIIGELPAFKKYIKILDDIEECYQLIDEITADDSKTVEEKEELIESYQSLIESKLIDKMEKITDTVYDTEVITRYDTENAHIVLEMINALIDELNYIARKYTNVYWMDECEHLRVPTMKYPNGAMRGIVILPIFPDMEDYEFSSLLVNHIQTTVNVYMPVRHHSHDIECGSPDDCHEPMFIKEKFGVMSNAMFKHEAHHCSDNPHNGSHVKFQSNRQMKTDILDGWDNAEDNNQEIINTNPDAPESSWNTHTFCCTHKPVDCEHEDYTYDQNILMHNNHKHDIVYLGDSCYSDKTKIMGLYRYMQHVTENNMWIKIGECYMAVAKDDNPQSHIYNLLSSVMVYNPNDIPVKVQYLIFS